MLGRFNASMAQMVTGRRNVPQLLQKAQGADMCIRLMKEYPQLKFAEGESDTGVIISFNSEAGRIDDSLTLVYNHYWQK